MGNGGHTVTDIPPEAPRPVGDPNGWASYVQSQTPTAPQTQVHTQPYVGAPAVAPGQPYASAPAAPPPTQQVPVAPASQARPAGGTIRDPNFDRAPIEVSGLIPIMATPTSRPLRTVAWFLLVIGVLGIVLSIVGGIVWSSIVDDTVKSTMSDVRDAMNDSDWEQNMDLDSTGDNLSGVLDLLGVGLAAIGALLGLTIVAIGGMALQLDRVLAPSRELASMPPLGQAVSP